MGLFRDLRLAFRGFARRPLLASGIVLTLAIGLGATTAIFAFFMGALRERFPAPDPERLFYVRPGTQEHLVWEMSYGEWTEHRRALGRIGRLEGRGGFSAVVGLPGQGTSEDLTAYGFGAAVSDGFFDLFPLRGRLLGRTFEASEHVRGGPSVALLDYSFWQQRLGGDRSILGRPIRLNGSTFTVIGVLPPRYQGSGWVYQIYIPLERLDDVSSAPYPLQEITATAISPILKVSPGVSQEAATTHLLATARELDETMPHPQGDRHIVLLNVQEYDDAFETADAALTGAVGCLLLLACANVANLLLTRAVGRRREIAVHAAMGAGPGRISRYLLVESVTLSLVGGAAGLGVARLLLSLFERILQVKPVGLGVWGQGTAWIQLDERSVIFAFALSLGTGVLFGLAPVVSAARSNLVGSLKSGSSDSSAGRRFGGRQLLVIAQVALSTVLLLGAGLLVRSLDSLLSRDPGYETGHRLLASIAVNPPKGADAEARNLARRQLYEFARQQVETLPGITGAALTTEAPGSTVAWQTRLVLPERADAKLKVERREVGPGFFETLGIAIRRGRPIDDRDVTGGSGAVVVSETFAERYWQGEDPLGRTIRLPDIGSDAESDRFTVVGVAADIASVSRLRQPEPVVYLPSEQVLFGTRMTIVAHVAGDPRTSLPAVRNVLTTAHPDLALVELATYDRQIQVDLGDQRLYSLLATLFGLFGLVLAALGIYSVMSVSVSYRGRELGIRMALGASGRDVIRLVLGETFFMVGLGVVIGIVGSLMLGRFIGSALHGVSAYEPLIFLGVPTFLTVVAFVAAWLPAWRAATVDPKSTLAAE